MSAFYPPMSGFSYGKISQTAATVIVRGVFPPHMGTGRSKFISHVSSLNYTIGTTAHVLTVMRPLNYTTFAADAAAAQAAVTLTADPGSYSTAYQYSLPNGVTAPRTANNLIAASDYVVYQTADGGYVVDTVASGSGTTPTLTTNLPTGGVKAGGYLWFFGVTTDTDPWTNLAHQQMNLEAAGSGTQVNKYTDQSGLWMSYHPGDPMIFHSSNVTTAGTFELLCGFYADR